jgi:nicotinamide-nucleotide amidase
MNTTIEMQSPNERLSSDLQSKLLSKHWKMCSAESLTGGLISAAMTASPGASQWWNGALVVYSNEAKTQLLGISEAMLRDEGPVSNNVAENMAVASLMRSDSNISVAVTGVAGPDSDEMGNPVGTVYIANAWWGSDGWVKSHVTKHAFQGTRGDIRDQTVQEAMSQTLQVMNT